MSPTRRYGKFRLHTLKPDTHPPRIPAIVGTVTGHDNAKLLTVRDVCQHNLQ
jgi:hypothetical protein